RGYWMSTIIRRNLYTLIVCTFPFVSSCTLSRSHTSDSALEQMFYQHEGDFAKLLADVQSDAKFQTLQAHSVSYSGQLLKVDERDFSEVESLGLSKERWTRYQQQLRALNLLGVFKGDARVEFRTDSGSFFNGDSYKGYEYRTTSPDHLRANLDGYR